MLSLTGKTRRLCDGIGRRDFVRVGTIAGLGLSLGDLPAASQPYPGADPAFGRAKRCVLLYLMGGPPQHDTWDLKPCAPAEIRGELAPIATGVPGIQISELFPLLSRQVEHCTILRSVTHTDETHTTAGYTMLTGADHPNPGALDGPKPNDFPHFGSVLAAVRGPAGGAPPFVALPEVVKDAAVNEVPGQRAGLLGTRFDPLLVEADSQRTGFHRPEIVLPETVSRERLNDRRRLLAQLDTTLASVEFQSMDENYRRAFAMIASPEVRRAFDLDQEPRTAHDAYGPHLFGQGCLLARRLLESGVRLVSVYWHYEGPDDSPVWDTHWNNYRHLRERLMPPADRAISALLQELHERGMLADTLVICMGEFGRSPKINAEAGRDHWPHVFSILLAGAGLPAGTVYGASDAEGAYPADRPVTPADLVATFLHLLGVPPDVEFHDRLQRPARIRGGEPLRGLLA